VTLSEVAELTEHGAHYPLFMLLLQQLHKTQGKPALGKLFTDSKINLLHMLPEGDRTKERLAEVLEDRDLSFLLPLLRIQAELWKQLQVRNSTPRLFSCLLKHDETKLTSFVVSTGREHLFPQDGF